MNEAASDALRVLFWCLFPEVEESGGFINTALYPVFTGLRSDQRVHKAKYN